jgi:protein-S-isoprenylcysteine O-methyltransferase Ste14
MKRIDLPPVWLLLAVLAAAALARLDPWRLTFGGFWWIGLLAGLLVGGGLLLIALSVMALRQARTAVHPRGQVTALVTQGPFAVSRNPVYLGMALVLIGLVLWLDSPLALPLLPLWVWWIERRFIRREEARIARDFGPAWAAYSRRVRRWL